jgi:VWFA-related protein
MSPRIVALVCGAALALRAPQQPPAFRSGVDAVRVDVQVMRNGQPVPGLTAVDFELKDSGVVQRIEALSLEQQPIDVLFALDTSASMSGEPLERLKDAAHAAIGVLDARDRIALLTFEHNVSRRLDWTPDRRSADAAIDGLTASGNTSLEDAAFAGFAFRERARGRMLELIFSDGFDTASWLDPVRVLDQARKSDLVVDAVLLGGLPPEIGREWFRDAPVPFREQFLPVLVDETGGDVLSAGRSDLKDAFVRILRLFKTRYVLSYVPENVAADGWHPISVRLTRVKADVRARRGYER